MGDPWLCTIQALFPDKCTKLWGFSAKRRLEPSLKLELAQGKVHMQNGEWAKGLLGHRCVSTT